MTKEERDAIRAAAAIENHARMLAGVSPPAVRKDETATARKAREANEYRRAVRRAEFAVSEANALIAELELHQQAEGVLFEDGTPADPRASKPECVHGIPFSDPCPLCADSDKGGGASPN
jgi:hypothetical protein